MEKSSSYFSKIVSSVGIIVLLWGVVYIAVTVPHYLRLDGSSGDLRAVFNFLINDLRYVIIGFMAISALYGVVLYFVFAGKSTHSINKSKGHGLGREALDTYLKVKLKMVFVSAI